MSSSFEKFNIDFSHLSFDSPSPVLDLKSDRQQISQQQQAPQAATLKRPGMTPRSTSRNKQCMPSDDEDEEEEDEEEDEEQDSDNEINKTPRGSVQKLAIATPSATKPIRKSRPLPSDDEDSEEEEQDEQHQQHQQHQGAGGDKQHTAISAGENRLHPNGNHAYQDYASYMQYQGYQQEEEGEDDDDDDDKALVTNPNAGPILTLVEGTHLQQLHQKQQQHQAQLAQFQYQQQQQQLQQHYYHQNHPHYQHHHQQQQQQQQQHYNKSRGNVSMSGMDLLKQLEQERADSKRIKPKLDTSKVKIEGLLGKLPEPGSHNISFQQIQQQQQQQQQHRKKNQYLDPFTLEKSRSPSPSRNSHRISHVSKQ